MFASAVVGPAVVEPTPWFTGANWWSASWLRTIVIPYEPIIGKKLLLSENHQAEVATVHELTGVSTITNSELFYYNTS